MKQGNNIQAFGDLLGRKIKGHQKVHTHWVKVSAVDWEDKTMTAIGVSDELPFYNVSLGLGSIYQKPKIDSLCLLGIIENQEATTFLIDAQAVECAVWTSGNSELTIKEKGFMVKQGDESLKTVLNDWQEAFGKLCDELTKVIVSVGVSPNIPVITKIKQEVNQTIKQRLNSILIG